MTKRTAIPGSYEDQRPLKDLTGDKKRQLSVTITTAKNVKMTKNVKKTLDNYK